MIYSLLPIAVSRMDKENKQIKKYYSTLGECFVEVTYKKIKTEVGFIDAKRNAIYLDYIKQHGNVLDIMGEINSQWCEKKSNKYKWYTYRLTIDGVKEYQAINIEDFYRKRINTESAFSEIINIPDNQADVKTIILETYDWAYIVTCKRFELLITGCR